MHFLIQVFNLLKVSSSETPKINAEPPSNNTNQPTKRTDNNDEKKSKKSRWD